MRERACPRELRPVSFNVGVKSTRVACHAGNEFRSEPFDNFPRHTERFETFESESHLECGDRRRCEHARSRNVGIHQPRSHRGEIFYAHKVEGGPVHSAKAETHQTLNVIEIEICVHQRKSAAHNN